MSLTETTLADFQQPETDNASDPAGPDPEAEIEPRPAWTPRSDDTSAAEHCQRCGSRVTKQFARVFGDNNDEVHGCRDCMTMSAVKRRGSLEGHDGDLGDGVHLGGGF